MALTMEAPATLEGHEEPATEQPATESISVDEANAELTDIGRETQNEVGQAEADAQADDQDNQVAVIDEDEKRFWATIKIKGQLAECGRDIRDSESKIEELKVQIKEEKEFLKGEQIRLTRLAGQLADIIDGHPLPVDPNAKPEKETPKLEGPTTASDGDDESESNLPNWRAMETGTLLDGLKGLGKKKLEALVDSAPTAGDLEDLRGEASRAHKHFREVLPDGFGEKIADAIEERLLDHVAKAGPSAEEQAAAERKAAAEEPDADQGDADQADEPTEGQAIAGKIEQREHDQIHGGDEQYEDVEDEVI